MELFSSLLMGVQVVSSLGIIALVLLQQGKGADMGSSFGGGSAGSLFGAAGAANFLSRMTKWAAIIFFASTIGLAWMAHHPSGSLLEGGVMQGFEREAPSAGSEVPGSGATGSEVPGASGSEVPGSSGSGDVPTPSGAAPQQGDDASVPAVPDVPAADSAASAPADAASAQAAPQAED